MLIDSISKMSGNTSRSLPSFVPTASRIAERIGNRYKANGGAEYAEQEWANGSGLEMYETFRHGGQVYRTYNAQIGRFMQGNPMMEATVTMSGYVFSGNNPVMFTDLLGDQYQYMDRNGNKWHHADIFAGTALEGTPYTEGWGADGFGNDPWGGGGGGSGKRGEVISLGDGYSFHGEIAQDIFKRIKQSLLMTDESHYSVFEFLVDANNNVHFSSLIINDLFSNNLTNADGYKDQTVSFQQSTTAYMFTEGVAFTASYAIKGYAKIFHIERGSGKFITWYITIGASGQTGASNLGKVNWFGNAQLLVGGKVTANYVIQNSNLNKEQINDPLWNFLGTATFLLPITNSTVQAKISIGYRFSNEQGNGGTPVPSAISHYINILH